MPWKDKLKQLKSEWDNLTADPIPQSGQQQYSHPLPHSQNQYPGQQQQQQYSHQQPYQQPYQQPPGHQQPPPVPTSRDYRVYWQPQFNPQTPVNVEWDPKIGNSDGWGNQELQFYTGNQENAFFTPDGKLVIRAISNPGSPSPEQRYTSARLVSRQTLGQDKGVLSGTILSPCASGIWPAFWLLPKEPFSWPVDGEIDIAETWNGDQENRTCLHWGHHHEPQKHRVMGTQIPDMHSRPIRYDFAWDQPGGQPGQGRMVWYIDGRPVMKGNIPQGTRPMREFSILLNVAMGGNVCGGKTPAHGAYDMVVYSLHIANEPEWGGWNRFEADYGNHGVPWGNTY